MTEKEMEIVKKYDYFINEARAAKEKAQDCLREMSELAPHKVGEIIKWKEQRAKNTGTVWRPNYEPLPDKERKAVLVNVSVEPYWFSFKDIKYTYIFHEIKNDGNVSKNVCRPWTNYEWTGEIHHKYKKEEN